MASTKNSVIHMRDLRWSPAEKAVARHAFQSALRSELEATIAEAKRRAAGITDISELWDLESFLTARRDEIDRRFDYRYSVLPEVFGSLVKEGRLTEQDLQGLSERKLEIIRFRAGS
jgi:hypothetical protein